MKRTLVLFDLDGTITRKDTLFGFILFAVGPWKFIIGFIRLIPAFFVYGIGRINNHQLKERVLKGFFANWAHDKFRIIGNKYAMTKLPGIIKPSALKRIKWHQKENHTIVIVSASIDLWLSKWCETLDLKLISTRLEFKNGTFTGCYETPNCYGHEKVKRLRAEYDLQLFDYIYAYGDSKGDVHMLSLADEKHYKYFK